MTAVRLGATALLLIGSALPDTQVLRAQPAFEGAITMRMTSKTPQGEFNQPIEYLMRGGKVRVNLAAPPGMPVAGASVIMVPQEKKMYMLLAAQNAYMEVAIPDSAAALAEVTKRAPAADDRKIVRTGKMETVAGMTCEHVKITSKTGSGDVCLSKELGRFVNPTSAMRPTGDAWFGALGNEFPMKVTLADGSVPIEVTKVERKRLSNDLFVVPGTYNKVTAPVGRPPAGKPPAR